MNNRFITNIISTSTSGLLPTSCRNYTCSVSIYDVWPMKQRKIHLIKEGKRICKVKK